MKSKTNEKNLQATVKPETLEWLKERQKWSGMTIGEWIDLLVEQRQKA